MTVAAQGNPLLALDHALPFDRIEAGHVEPAVGELLARSKKALDAVKAEKGARTYANTVRALERATDDLGIAMGVVGHLEAVATTAELRAAYNAVQPEVSAFFSGIALDAELYAALKAFAQTAEAKALTGARQRFFEKTLADFRRHGAELDGDGKKRLEAIDVELSKHTVRFSQNVLDASAAFELLVEDEARLAGLPESALAGARESAAQKGKSGYRFTLQGPSYIAVVTYADDARLRETMWRAFNTRATVGEQDNRPLLARILTLRAEKAALLGFENFADLVLEDRMAKKGGVARGFIARLRAKTEHFFEEENKALNAFRKSLEGPDAKPLQPWDVAYYSEKERKALYDFDEEALRPYFSADATLAGLFRLAHTLYGVTIEPWEGVPVWHESVKGYRVVDGDGAWLGSFYVDVYPRETKRDGAWMDGLITGVAAPDGRIKHLEVLAANVTPPLPGQPALLTHREVETLFHEFGHLMHHVLSKVEVRSLSGCNVAWDFVELPSMIMENWTWDAKILASFAAHFETRETIPPELVAKLKRAKNYRAANAMMRQLGFAALDLDMHMVWNEGKGDIMAFARDLFAAYAPSALPPDYGMVASFSHLFSSPVGYAAGYYSYKWAEVLDADAFSRFEKEGLENPATGKAFREAILSKGDSRDPQELFRAFLGRDPSEDAMFRRAGLGA